MLVTDKLRLEAAQAKAKHTARLGLEAEDTIRKYLRSIGHPTVDSTKFENMMLDIDCHHAIMPVSISIKCMNKARHTGNLCFETHRFNMQAAFDYHEVRYETSHPLYAQLEKESHPRFWQPSWYEYGASDWYIVGVADNLLKIKTTQLHDYVKTVGWDAYREHLSSALRLEHAGRKYTDYKVGLVTVDELLHFNIAQYIRKSHE
jgi:hypothetical protein